MKRRSRGGKADELRPEYDLAKVLKVVSKGSTQSVIGKERTSLCWLPTLRSRFRPTKPSTRPSAGDPVEGIPGAAKKTATKA